MVSTTPLGKEPFIKNVSKCPLKIENIAIHASEPGASNFEVQGLSLTATRDVEIELDVNCSWKEFRHLTWTAMTVFLKRHNQVLKGRSIVELKARYKGGLQVSMLGFTRVNLEKAVMHGVMDKSASTQPKYNSKTSVVKQIIDSTRISTESSNSALTF